MSDDLTAFLRARLDEDEEFLRTVTEVGQQKADAATAKDMADAMSLAMMMLSDPRMKALLDRWESMPPPTDTRRLLREVAAKRAIIALADQIEPAPDANFLYIADGILRYLAAVYRDHPDYRQEWTP